MSSGSGGQAPHPNFYDQVSSNAARHFENALRQHGSSQSQEQSLLLDALMGTTPSFGQTMSPGLSQQSLNNNVTTQQQQFFLSTLGAAAAQANPAVFRTADAQLMQLDRRREYTGCSLPPSRVQAHHASFRQAHHSPTLQKHTGNDHSFNMQARPGHATGNSFSMPDSFSVPESSFLIQASELPPANMVTNQHAHLHGGSFTADQGNFSHSQFSRTAGSTPRLPSNLSGLGRNMHNIHNAHENMGVFKSQTQHYSGRDAQLHSFERWDSNDEHRWETEHDYSSYGQQTITTMPARNVMDSTFSDAELNRGYSSHYTQQNVHQMINDYSRRQAGGGWAATNEVQPDTLPEKDLQELLRVVEQATMFASTVKASPPMQNAPQTPLNVDITRKNSEKSEKSEKPEKSEKLPVVSIKNDTQTKTRNQSTFRLLLDADGNILQVFGNVFDAEPRRLITRNLSDFIRADAMSSLATALLMSMPVIVEFRVGTRQGQCLTSLHKAGVHVVLVAHGLPDTNSSQCKVYRDLPLLEVQNQFVSFHTLTPDCTTIFVTNSILDLYGIAVKNFTHKSPFLFHHPDDISRIILSRKVMNRHKIKVRFRIRSDKREWRWAEAIAYIHTGEDGRPSYVVVIAQPCEEECVRPILAVDRGEGQDQSASKYTEIREEDAEGLLKDNEPTPSPPPKLPPPTFRSPSLVPQQPTPPPTTKVPCAPPRPKSKMGAKSVDDAGRKPRASIVRGQEGEAQRKEVKKSKFDPDKPRTLKDKIMAQQMRQEQIDRQLREISSRDRLKSDISDSDAETAPPTSDPIEPDENSDQRGGSTQKLNEKGGSTPKTRISTKKSGNQPRRGGGIKKPGRRRLDSVGSSEIDQISSPRTPLLDAFSKKVSIDDAGKGQNNTMQRGKKGGRQSSHNYLHSTQTPQISNNENNNSPTYAQNLSTGSLHTPSSNGNRASHQERNVGNVWNTHDACADVGGENQYGGMEIESQGEGGGEGVPQLVRTYKDGQVKLICDNVTLADMDLEQAALMVDEGDTEPLARTLVTAAKHNKHCVAVRAQAPHMKDDEVFDVVIKHGSSMGIRDTL